MTSLEILTYLEQRSVRLRLAGNELEVDAPESALTPDLVERIRAHKAELLALLKPSVWLRHSHLPEFCPLDLCGGRLVPAFGWKGRATCSGCGIHFELECAANAAPSFTFEMEERAAILEYGANLSRDEAERQAATSCRVN